MADTSYLFGGSTPSSVSGSVSSANESLPAWLQEYTRALMGQATQVAGTPYTQYGGDRIAGFGPLQTMAQQVTQDNAGSWQPFVDYASQTLPQGIQNYMNPYTDSVVDRIAQLGQRNLTENLLPNVNSTFIGTGQFGSDRNSEFMSRALRDANESILGQQSQALQSGYQNAAQNFLQDTQRMGALGQLQSQLGYTDASMLDTLGLQQQNLNQRSLDLGYSNFLEQRDYPRAQIDFLNSIIRGMPVNQEQFRTTSTLTSPNLSNTISPTSSALQAATGVAGVRKALGLG